MELKDFIPTNSNQIFKDFSQEQIESINQVSGLRNKVIAILKLIYDPEISVNIWDLGLIYRIDIKDNIVYIKMTLTSPTCPVADAIPNEVKKKIELIIEEISEANVEIVWQPKWNKSMMSEEAKLILDLV